MVLKILFFIFNRGVFPSPVYLYISGYMYICTHMSQSLEEGFGSLEAGVPGGCEPPSLILGIELGSSVILASGPTQQAIPQSLHLVLNFVV